MKKYLLIFLFTLFISVMMAQSKQVTGIVTDDYGSGLPGVTVVLKGTTEGIITDTNGNYTLSGVSSEGTLVFSFIGMKTQEIPVSGRTNINVTMSEELIGLDEVVAVGYGTVKKSDLTGSVASISEKDFGDRIVSDVPSLIQGKASGVDVSNGKIRIRGTTSFNNTDPLYVIDGFVGGDISVINPNNIASIEILKDASSTAIYGSRGANGVILITTKKGKKGDLKINISTFAGISFTPNKLDLLNAKQYNEYMKDNLTNAGIPLSDKLLSSEVLKDETNWQDVAFKTAWNSETNIDFSGGTENSDFFVGLGYRKSEGPAIGDQGTKSYFAKLVNNFTLAKWIKIGTNISANYSVAKVVNLTSGEDYKSKLAFIQMPPYYPVYDKNNSWGFSDVNRAEDLTDVSNPAAIIFSNHPDNHSLNYQFNSYIEITPLEGLVLRTQGGITGNFAQDRRWRDYFVVGGGVPTTNSMTENSSYGLSPILETYLTYSKDFGKHSISLMAGNSIQKDAYRGSMGIEGINYINTDVKNIFVAPNSFITNDARYQSSYLSYFGRVNYQYNDKYLLTVNFRRDGSPKFSPKHRWADFPSVALAWKLHQEDFIKELGIFDQLKLRGSWGMSGNDAIGDFRYLSQVATMGIFYPFGDPQTYYQGATVRENNSPDIKWETTESANIGADMTFLDNRLNFTVEVFNKKTNDILFGVPRPVSLGYFGNAVVNAASMVNKGLEVQLGYRGKLNDFSYSINGNYSYVHNEVTSLGLGQPFLSVASRTIEGYPIAHFYGFTADGIFKNQSEVDAANNAARETYSANHPDATDAQLANIYYQSLATSPGDVKFRDLNNDGIVDNANDRTMIGNSVPKHLFGLSTSLSYKNFDFNVIFQGIAGADVYNANYATTRAGTFSGNQEAVVLDRWRSESEPGNGIVPRAIAGDPAQNNRISTLMLQSGDYLKMRQLSIGYSLPDKLISKLSLSQARIYVSGSNLLTFSKYDGYDPEVGGDNLMRGYDRLDYPEPSKTVFGIQISF